METLILVDMPLIYSIAHAKINKKKKKRFFSKKAVICIFVNILISPPQGSFVCRQFSNSGFTSVLLQKGVNESVCCAVDCGNSCQ